MTTRLLIVCRHGRGPMDFSKLYHQQKPLLLNLLFVYLSTCSSAPTSGGSRRFVTHAHIDSRLSSSVVGQQLKAALPPSSGRTGNRIVYKQFYLSPVASPIKSSCPCFDRKTFYRCLCLWKNKLYIRILIHFSYLCSLLCCVRLASPVIIRITAGIDGDLKFMLRALINFQERYMLIYWFSRNAFVV